MTSDGSSMVSVTVSRDSRDSLSTICERFRCLQSQLEANSLSSSASDRSVKRGHRRTTSRAMGSIIAMSRTLSQTSLKNKKRRQGREEDDERPPQPGQVAGAAVIPPRLRGRGEDE